MKILNILDGLLNQLIPFIRWVINRFKKTPIENEKEIDQDVNKERDESKRTGRPKWDA